MKRILTSALCFICLTAATALLLQNYQNHGASQTAIADPTVLQFESVAKKYVEGIGFVEPRSEIRRLAPRTGGMIQACLLKPGEFVPRGGLLAVMDSDVSEAQLSVAEAQLDLARKESNKIAAGVNPKRIEYEKKVLETLLTRAQFAETQLVRIREARSRNAASAEDLDISQHQRNQADHAISEQRANIFHYENFVTQEDIHLAAAKVRHAETLVEEARQLVEHSKLVASADGTVLRWLKREGESVSHVAPEPILLFGDLTRLTVRAEIDERSAALIERGMRAEVFGRNLMDAVSVGEVETVEKVMGAKTVFTQAASERKDINVIQVVVLMPEGFKAPVGLRVDVKVYLE